MNKVNYITLHWLLVIIVRTYGPFTPKHIGQQSDGHFTKWVLYPILSMGGSYFFLNSINVHIFECLYTQFIKLLLCYVVYFSLLIWHTRSCLDPFSILFASDVCECNIVLYRNPFCLMAIRCKMFLV